MEPARQAAMKYKAKLITMRGAVSALPIPNAIAASFREKSKAKKQKLYTRFVQLKTLDRSALTVLKTPLISIIYTTLNEFHCRL